MQEKIQFLKFFATFQKYSFTHFYATYIIR